MQFKPTPPREPSKDSAGAAIKGKAGTTNTDTNCDHRRAGLRRLLPPPPPLRCRGTSPCGGGKGGRCLRYGLNCGPCVLLVRRLPEILRGPRVLTCLSSGRGGPKGRRGVMCLRRPYGLHHLITPLSLASLDSSPRGEPSKDSAEAAILKPPLEGRCPKGGEVYC